MEVLKNSINNKSSLILSKNSKKQTSIQNLKQSIKNKDSKYKHLVTIKQNKAKCIPLFAQKNYKPNQSSKIKPININNKELLTNNLLIRALSYKKIDKNENKGKNSSKLTVNKKIKKKILYYKTQKIIDDMNKDLTNNNVNLNNNLTNIQNKEINNELQIIKSKNLSNLNNEDITIINNKDNKIINKKNEYSSINVKINTMNNNNIHSIISLLTSKNKIFKRNTIQNLKNMSLLNRKAYNSNYKSNYNSNKNNYINLMSSSNSYLNYNLNNNFFKNKHKLNSINYLDISNNINSIISPTSNSINNLNTTNNTISNYSYKINHLSKQNKRINYNFNIKSKDDFKNCKSQKYKKLNTNIINNLDNLTQNTNYYINTNSSNNNKYIDKIKPSLKLIDDNNIKSIILDNKINCQFLKRNKTERGGNSKDLSLKEKIYQNFLNNIGVKNQLTDYNNNSSNKNKNKNKFFEGINHIKNMNKISPNYNTNKKKNTKILLLNNSSIFSPIIKLKNKRNNKHNVSIGAYSSKFNNLNINKNNKSNINININNIGNSEKVLKNKFCIDNNNNNNNNHNNHNSFSTKLGNKLNYLNINLNNLSNINNTLSNNTQNITTFPTHINTMIDNSFNNKTKIKNKFLRKNNDSFFSKSLINSNNNIIILNNISMNNLNNISFDYLSRLTKKQYQNSYKSIESIKNI